MQIGKKETIEKLTMAILEGYEKEDDENTMSASEIYNIAQDLFEDEMINITLKNFTTILWIISRQWENRIIKTFNKGKYYLMPEDKYFQYIGQ